MTRHKNANLLSGDIWHRSLKEKVTVGYEKKNSRLGRSLSQCYLSIGYRKTETISRCGNTDNILDTLMSINC